MLGEFDGFYAHAVITRRFLSKRRMPWSSKIVKNGTSDLSHTSAVHLFDKFSPQAGR